MSIPDDVIVNRTDADPEDVTVGAFLALLARDIEVGRNVHGLPEDLARTALEHAGQAVNLDDGFDEDVEV